MAARIRPPVVRIRVDLKGPLFRPDPGRIVVRNAQAMMADLAAEGAREAQARIASIPPAGVRTGERRRRVVGRTRSLSGREWTATAIIGIPRAGPLADQVRTFAAMSRIESLAAPMGRAASDLDAGSRAVARADLTKGLA